MYHKYNYIWFIYNKTLQQTLNLFLKLYSADLHLVDVLASTKIKCVVNLIFMCHKHDDHISSWRGEEKFKISWWLFTRIQFNHFIAIDYFEGIFIKFGVVKEASRISYQLSKDKLVYSFLCGFAVWLLILAENFPSDFKYTCH
jgi:hypothetical protein